MRLHQFFSILRARSRLGMAIFLGVLAITAIWLLVRTPSYVAKAPVLVDVRTDPVGTTPQGVVTPGYIATQIDVVKSRPVAQRVVKMLPADQEPMLRLKAKASESPTPDEWIVNALQRELEVTPARESNIIQIAWSGRSAQEAARVANAFAEAYMETNVDLRTAPAKRYTAWFDQQMQQARERLQAAQTKLAEFQQKSGLISTTGQADYEQQRLADLSNQLLAAQGHRTTAVTPDAAMSSEVGALRADVSRLQAKLDEAGATLGSNHPKMLQMNAELRSMRERLAEASARAGQVSAGASQASAQRIRELQSQLEAQRARVLSLARDRGDFNVLEQEVVAAQKAYDTVAANAAQLRLQGLSTQGNVVFLGSAAAPLQPSGPSGLVAIAIAAVCGLILALMGSLLAEISNRRVRSKEDIESLIGLPILGVVPAPASRARLLPLGGARPQLSFQPSRSAA
jgi:polysaccharide biosynthesis transport protein